LVAARRWERSRAIFLDFTTFLLSISPSEFLQDERRKDSDKLS
jgi:hypothetical protein